MQYQGHAKHPVFQEKTIKVMTQNPEDGPWKAETVKQTSLTMNTLVPAVYSWWPFITIPLTASCSLHVEGDSRLQLHYIVYYNSILNCQQLHKGAKDSMRNPDWRFWNQNHKNGNVSIAFRKWKRKTLEHVWSSAKLRYFSKKKPVPNETES